MHNQIAPRNTRPDSSGFQISQTMTRQVMSSREIAELLGSRHDKVKQSIDRLIARGTIVQPPVGDEQEPDSLGRPRSLKVYLIGKRDTYVIVAQLSPEFTARLVDRWQELEAQAETAAFAIPQTKAEALRLAADLEEQNERLHLVILKQAPKVAAIERLAAAHGAVCLTDAAKLLQVTPRRFIAWLIDRDWIYQRGKKKRLAADQKRIDQGFMTHKFTELKPDELTGEPRAVAQPLVTPKGLTRLGEMLQEAL